MCGHETGLTSPREVVTLLARVGTAAQTEALGALALHPPYAEALDGPNGLCGRLVLSVAVVEWDSDDTLTASLVRRVAGGEAALANLVESVPALRGRQVKLRALPQGISGATVFLAYPMSFGGRIPQDEEPGVLKIASAPQLRQEVANYEKYVEPLLKDSSSFPRLSFPGALETTQEQSAIFYRRVGDLPFGERLRELLAEEDTAAIDALFKRLFSILRRWEDQDISDSMELTELYAFGASPFDEYETTIEQLNGSFAERAVTSYETTRMLWEPHALEPTHLRLAVGHGDLNTENILVDRDRGDVTLIDFATVGEGHHFLRDMATLEAHLVLRALPPDEAAASTEHESYLDEALGLYDAERLFSDSRSASVAGARLEMAIRPIRRHAWLLMREADEFKPQYAYALLRHAVRTVIREDQNMPERHRWLSAHIASHLTSHLTIDRGRLRFRPGRVSHQAMPNVAEGRTALLAPPRATKRCLKEIGHDGDHRSDAAYRTLEVLGLATAGRLTPAGESYKSALDAGDAKRQELVLNEVLSSRPFVTAFVDGLPAEGATAAEAKERMRALEPSRQADSARRWIEWMLAAGLVRWEPSVSPGRLVARR